MFVLTTLFLPKGIVGAFSAACARWQVRMARAAERPVRSALEREPEPVPAE